MPITYPTLLTFLLWLAACLTSLFTILGFLNRLDWRLELFCHFRAQYALILGSCAAFLLMSDNLPGFCFALAGMLVNLTLLLPFYRKPAHSSPPRAVYRVFFANILGPNTRYRDIQKAIKQANPDIILLVEVRPNHLEALLPGLGAYPHQFTLPDDENFGLAIFSRLPFEKIDIKDFDGTCTPTLIARLTLEAGQLTLIGMHPHPPKSREQARRRNHQLATVGAFVADQPGELLLMGDLNTTSWSHSFKQLLATSRLMDSSQGCGWQPSWPANNPLLGIPIDHALHTPGVVIQERRLGRPTGSDHRPLILDFSFIAFDTSPDAPTTALQPTKNK